MALVSIFRNYGDKDRCRDVEEKVRKKVNEYENNISGYIKFCEYSMDNHGYPSNRYFLVPPQESKMFADSLLSILTAVTESTKIQNFKRVVDSLDQLPDDIKTMYHDLFNAVSDRFGPVKEDEQFENTVDKLISIAIPSRQIIVRIGKGDILLLAGMIKFFESRGEVVTESNLAQLLKGMNKAEFFRDMKRAYVSNSQYKERVKVLIGKLKESPDLEREKLSSYLQVP